MDAAAVTAKPNRLIHEKSPYLLQHAYNPVDWYPWGEEALQAARSQDKPIFLSLGYSTCHWCHVMERESFEHADVAEWLNRDFISIKVDREERPDLDEIYMAATQLMTGQGGWPNSVWLTPDGRPWFAGTYFPPEDCPGMTGFRTILSLLAEAWKNRRSEVMAQAGQMAQALLQVASVHAPSSRESLDRSMVEAATVRLNRNFDSRHGGFGRAPKFPPHQGLSLIAAELARHQAQPLTDMLTLTLEGMFQGGIHDHVGGGFHRYSTDERWFLPHFEKMLYDNALLGRAYVDGFALTGQADFAQAARGIYRWVSARMTDERGGFFSGLDADSEGVEGKFYLWSQVEILHLLGQEESELFCRIFNVEPDGNYRDEATGQWSGVNVLYLARSIQAHAKVEDLDEDDLRQRLLADLATLENRRREWTHPHRDDKILTAWNGLMIGSLAYAGRNLDEPAYTASAVRAAEFVLRALRRDDGRLMRSFRDGAASGPGFLDDYAFLADGLLDLHQATHDGHWLAQAKSLADEMIRLFGDSAGGFYYSAADQSGLLVRMKSPFDAATPSPNAVAVRVLTRLGDLTGDEQFLRQARATLDAYSSFLAQQPSGLDGLYDALGLYLDVAGEGPPVEPAAQVLAAVKQGPVKAELLGASQPVHPGQAVNLRVRLSIDPSWHVNSARPVQKDLLPTRISLVRFGHVSLGQIAYPPGEWAQLPFRDEPMRVYQGQVELDVPLEISADAPAGPLDLALQIRTQPCDNRSCQLPQSQELRFTLEVQRKGQTGPE